jgi:hypothetical protein
MSTLAIPPITRDSSTIPSYKVTVANDKRYLNIARKAFEYLGIFSVVLYFGYFPAVGNVLASKCLTIGTKLVNNKATSFLLGNIGKWAAALPILGYSFFSHHVKDNLKKNNFNQNLEKIQSGEKISSFFNMKTKLAVIFDVAMSSLSCFYFFSFLGASIKTAMIVTSILTYDKIQNSVSSLESEVDLLFAR